MGRILQNGQIRLNTCKCNHTNHKYTDSGLIRASKALAIAARYEPGRGIRQGPEKLLESCLEALKALL